MTFAHEIYEFDGQGHKIHGQGGWNLRALEWSPEVQSRMGALGMIKGGVGTTEQQEDSKQVEGSAFSA